MEPLNAEVDEWEVAVNRVLLQDVIGRGAFGAVWRALLSSPNGQPGNRTVAAKCFTRKPPTNRCIDTYVDLRGRYKNVLFGERWGGRVVQNYFLTNAHLPLLHSRLRAGKKEKARGGREDKQTYKIINQFGSKSDSGIAVILQ